MKTSESNGKLSNKDSVLSCVQLQQPQEETPGNHASRRSASWCKQTLLSCSFLWILKDMFGFYLHHACKQTIPYMQLSVGCMLACRSKSHSGTSKQALWILKGDRWLTDWELVLFSTSPSIVCTHIIMSGYTRPPPGGGGYGKSSGGGSGFGRGGGNQEETCNYCKKPGHYKRNCPQIAAKERHAQRFSSNAGPSNLNPKSSSSQPPSGPSGKKSDSKNSSTPVVDSEEPPSSSTTTDSPKTVLTNHLSIQSLPKQVYIYILEFFRETNATGREVLITRKFEKQGLFEDDLRLRHECTDLQPPRPSNWVTDYNNIWSTRPLFNNAAGPNTEVVNVANLQANDPNSLRQVRAESARITFHKVVFPLQTIAPDFRPTDNNESALLQRGLNAMITKHARLSSQPPTPALIQIGANKFYRRNDHFGLGESQDVRAFHGYFLSTRPGTDQFFLNVNLRCSPFLPAEVVLDSLLQMFRDDAPATSTLRGIKVQLLNRGTHPHQGIEFVKSVKSSMRGWDIDVGSANNEVLLDSAGLQTAEHYPYRQALSGKQTSLMIKQALKRLRDHIKRLTMNAVAMFGLDRMAFQASLLNDFQLVINTDLQSVPYRLLAPPGLQYNLLNSNTSNEAGQRKVVNDIEGASWNLKDLKLHAKGQTSRVIILDFTSGFKRVFCTRFQEALKSAGDRHGFKVRVDGPLSTQVSASPSEHAILNEISKRIAEHNKGTEIAFVLGLSRHKLDVYARIKRIAELHLGVKTTCVDAENMEDTKSLDQYSANVVLKLNLKGNGINHTVTRSTFGELYSDTQQTVCDTIVIGADVTHPTGHYAPGCPSLAAVVGSVDDDFVKFPGSMRLQRSRKETITELADMVMERLVDWARQHRDRLPGRMLFYRDGVSESQFQSVRESEIRQLQQAFDMADSVLKGVKNNSQVPFKLTFVVVGKRHNTRFFPEAKIEKGLVSFKTKERTKNDNVLPGTVVDQVITPRGTENFYLQSHMPVQGTGKSAHYSVLQNGMELTSHQLQQITHGFCYTYARATKGVSYCSPAYYADRLCDRGRAYIRDWLIGKKDFGPDRPKRKGEKHDDYLDHVAKYLSDDLYYRPDKTTPKYDRPRKNPWHPNLDGIMFYL